MKGKRGYIISYADWMKGFFIGLIVGAVLVYLFMSGTISLPSGFMQGKEAAKAVLPLLV